MAVFTSKTLFIAMYTLLLYIEMRMILFRQTSYINCLLVAFISLFLKSLIAHTVKKNSSLAYVCSFFKQERCFLDSHKFFCSPSKMFVYVSGRRIVPHLHYFKNVCEVVLHLFC